MANLRPRQASAPPAPADPPPPPIDEPIELAWPEQHQPQPHLIPRTLPPTQPAPLISGLIETVLTTSPTVPPATVKTQLTGSNTNPLTTVPPSSPATTETLVVTIAPGQLYHAAGANIPLNTAGGSIALPSALLTTRITAISVGIRDQASTSVPTVVEAEAITLLDSAAVLMAAGMATAAAPWVINFPSGLPVTAAGSLSLSYSSTTGNLTMWYTISGTAP